MSFLLTPLTAEHGPFRQLTGFLQNRVSCRNLSFYLLKHKTHRYKNFNPSYHPKWRCTFWEITSGSYSGMESSQWGSEESQNQVVPVAFSIGHGVIKSLTLIPLQTCIPPVAYMQPALLFIQQQLKNDLRALIKELIVLSTPTSN